MLTCNVIGNLGDDAVLYENNGKPFVSFKVAHTRSYKKSDGTEVKTTQWVSCALNGKAEGLFLYLKKGVKVFVSGNLSTRVYSSPKERCMVAGLDLSVTSVELCGGSSERVPRQLVDSDGIIYEPTKQYYLGGIQNKELFSLSGQPFVVDEQGLVEPFNTENNDTK